MLSPKQRAHDSIVSIRAQRRKKETAFAQLPYEERMRLKEVRKQRILKDQVGIILWDNDHGMLNKTKRDYLLEVLAERVHEIVSQNSGNDHKELARIQKLQSELEKYVVLA